MATWKSSNLHVAIFLFPRGCESFLPKFHFILPKNFFFSTWGFSISYVETVAKVNKLTILLARLSRLCRKDEAQGAEGEV